MNIGDGMQRDILVIDTSFWLDTMILKLIQLETPNTSTRLASTRRRVDHYTNCISRLVRCVINTREKAAVAPLHLEHIFAFYLCLRWYHLCVFQGPQCQTVDKGGVEISSLHFMLTNCPNWDCKEIPTHVAYHIDDHFLIMCAYYRVLFETL